MPKVLSPTLLLEEKRTGIRVIEETTERFELPPDGWFLKEAIDQKMFDTEMGLFMVPGTDRLVSFEETLRLQVIHPNSATVLEPSTRHAISLLKSVEKGILDSTGHYINNKTKEKFTMKEAIMRKLVLLKERRQVIEERTTKEIHITKMGDQFDQLTVVAGDFDKSTSLEILSEVGGFPKSQELHVITVEYIEIAPNIYFEPESVFILDGTNGEKMELTRAVSLKKIDGQLFSVREPKTGTDIPLDEAMNKGVVDTQTGDYTDETSGRKVPIKQAFKDGVIKLAPIQGTSETKIMKSFKSSPQTGTMQSKAIISLEDPKTGECIPLELALKRGIIDSETFSKVHEGQIKEFVTITKAIDQKESCGEVISKEKFRFSTEPEKPLKIPSRETTDISHIETPPELYPEPGFEVTIGRAWAQEGITLQKVRRRIMSPREAAKEGILDSNTANILTEVGNRKGSDGKPMTLTEAIRLKLIDGNSGTIPNPCKGQTVNILEALENGILDSVSGKLILPVGQSLALPEAVSQGLVLPAEQKIIHPEVGLLLTLNESLLCEIINPLSQVLEPVTKRIITLEEAIEKGIIDQNTLEVRTTSSIVSLVDAIKNYRVFEKARMFRIDNMPLLGLTFPVALQYGFIDTETKEFVHLISNKCTPLRDAIKQGLIMILPIPPILDSIEVLEALDKGLINSINCTMKHPRTGRDLPVQEAVDTGLLQMKPILPQSISVESFLKTLPTQATTSLRMVVESQTIELQPGYIMTSPRQVEDTETGEIIPIEDAKSRGIVKINIQTLRTTEPLTFIQSLERGLLSLSDQTFTEPLTGKTLPISQAISEGLLNPIEEFPTQEVIKYTIMQVFSVLYDENSELFHHPNTQKLVTFEELMDEGFVDLDAVIYDVPTGQPMTTKEAIEMGKVDIKTGKILDSITRKRITTIEATKMGLVFVISEPVIGGMTTLEGLKSLASKEKPKSESLPLQKIPSSASSKTSTSFPSREVKQFSPKEEKPPSTKTPSKPRKEDLSSPETHRISPQDDTDLARSEICLTETFTELSKDFEAPLFIGHSLPLCEAVDSGLINPDTTYIFSPSTNEKSLVQNALKDATVPADAIVVISSKTEVTLVEQKPELATPLSVTFALQEGYYDQNTESFVNPQTGEPATFMDLVVLGVIDPYKIKVRDLRSKEFVPLLDAVKKVLIDKNTGQMVNPKTGQRISFFEAVQLEWIIYTEHEKPSTLLTSLTFQQAIENKLFDTESVTIIHPISRNQIPLSKALETRLIDPNSVVIYNTKMENLLSVKEAENIGLINLHHNTYINLITKEEISLNTAYKRGYITVLRYPVSLVAIIKKELYNPNTGTIKDPVTNYQMNIYEAVKKNLVDAFITKVRDTKNENYVSLDEALQTNIIVPKSGKMKDTAKNTFLTLDVAVTNGLIISNRIQVSLIDAINQEFYKPDTGRFEDPVTGDDFTLDEAIHNGFIDVESAQVKDARFQILIPLKEAITTGIVDGQRGTLTYPNIMTLDVAVLNGFLITTRFPWTLQEALENRMYDTETGLMIDPDKGEKISLEEAVTRGWIEQKALTVKDPRSNDMLTLIEAIKIGIIDPVSGIVTDPSLGSNMHFYDALDRGLIIPAKRGFSLPEAIYKGFYDPKTGKFASPESLEKLTVDKAVVSGLIDPTSTLVQDGISGNILTFSQAMLDGVVDVKEGKITLNKAGKKVNFQEALDHGLLIEISRPLALREAIRKGIYDETTGKFLDPSLGQWLTLQEAINSHLIDPDSAHLRDTQTGFLKQLTLIDAIEAGLLNQETGKLTQPDGQEITLVSAFKSDLIMESKISISVQKAIHQGLYNEEMGKFTDPSTGKMITLQEAVRQFVINASLPCYWERSTCTLQTLKETIHAGIIDQQSGKFREPDTSIELPLNVALEKGLIVDIEKPLGLYKFVTMGLYSAQTGKIVHPSNGTQLSLEDAIKEEVIDNETSIIKNRNTGKYMKLPEAIHAKIINPYRGCYVVPVSKEELNFYDAVGEGLIVSAKKPLTLQEAIKMKLFNPASGQFTDITTGDQLNLAQAIEHGLIDGSSTFVRDPQTDQLMPIQVAIEQKFINVSTGTIREPLTGNFVSIIIAFERGMIISTERPTTFHQAVQQESIDFTKGTFKDASSTAGLMLEEVIKNELIDPESAVIKDPVSGRFKTLKQAIKDGLLDVKKKVMFDPMTEKATTLTITFDQETVIFFREPKTFDQAIDSDLLHLTNGQFKHPDSEKSIPLYGALKQGVLDPNSVVIKDTKRKKLVKILSAFEQEILDPDKSTVLNTGTNQILTIEGALEANLIITPRRPLSLLEALEYGAYDPDSGSFRDPFTEHLITLLQAIDSGLIDPTDTVFRDPGTGRILTIQQAADECLLNPREGVVFNPQNQQYITLVQAWMTGLFITAETRTAVEEKYKFAGDSISKLLNWIDDIREQLAELGQIQDDILELQNQIEKNRDIKNDLDDHQRAVSTCLNKVHQIVQQGAEVLSKDEIEQLQKDCKELKKHYDKTLEESEKLLHRLVLSQEELEKFNVELLTFKKWLLEAEEKLKEQEKNVGDLKNLKENGEYFKEFTNDVIAHQADLRFITMIAQRFVDESKEYLKILNNIRTNLPRRRAHVEPKESEVKAQVSVVSTTYQNLLNQVNRLRDKITTVEARQRHYSECLEKATSWLLEVQTTSRKLLDEPVAAEPKLIQDQLDRIKTVSLDIVSQSRVIENIKQAGKTLLDTLEKTETSIVEKQSIENTVQKLEDDHCTVSNDINEKSNELQTALVQSQDIQDGLDRLLKWLNETETIFRTQNKAISLSRERLDEQVQEHKIFQTDIDSQRPSIDAVTASAKDLSKGSNQRLAKKVETKMKDINTRFDKLCEKSRKRGILLEEVVTLVSTFEVMILHFEEWIHEITETLESREIVDLTPEEYCTQIEDAMNQRNAKKEDFDKMIKTGKNLVAKRDVTDTAPRKDKVKLLEQQWKELGDLLTEKQQAGKTRTQQLSAYETLRIKVLEWLNDIEGRVEELEVVVIDKDALQHQAAELKPIIKEHIDYAPTVDKVNVLGNSYDIILHGERGDSPRRHIGSPTKKFISSTSPTKKSPARTRHSPDIQSPTQGKSVSVQSPLSSISSGFSSQRSSADNLGGVEDLTPIQQQLSEINNRYSLLGVKLSDRQQEIESLTEETKCHLLTMKTLVNFVKGKEKQLPKESFPENKEQAGNQLHILKVVVFNI
ncbi:uncharacterized protein LOC106470391 [Limulus polyphemus]|uniref:Uncharacterized protein LOC106470391 n=1 Tax=Limulus polyphemus TaxID=6850 RepID=A0ABM1BPX8_LIMPO|nr:uncharacterized protein LOC106470391 [Limulus polyphemus]